MAQIEITAAIRRPQEEIFAYLEDLSNYRQFLPKEDFDKFRSGDAVGGRNSAMVRWKAFGRWWPAELEIDHAEAPGLLKVRSVKTSLPFTWTWTLEEMKKDRRGERTEVHLKVEVKAPGGMLGSRISNRFLEGPMMKTYDALLRNLESALGATPRSGLKAR